ncbi:KdsC family phosphatase [Vampirovibrio sp.]|uniref:KdsC family phosphatase n=1 Tax=Vampirovibrio sp. TaxID=2717857 RepID=UPI0035944913
MTLLSLHSPDLSAASVALVVFDFDGVFTDNTVWVTEDGKESVRCWRSDGLGLEKLRLSGLPVWVLSTEVNPAVAHRCKKLGLPVQHGLANKQEALIALTQKLGVPLLNTVYVGNDINDRGCLEIAGLPVVVQDAHPDVLPLAKYQTQRAGGFGAVREVCDWLMANRTEGPVTLASCPVGS